MRKIIIMLFLLVIMCTGVFAAGKGNMIKDSSGDLITSHKYVHKFKGLENALIHVKNNQATEKLLGNLERFRERYQNRFENCETNCTIELDEGNTALDLSTVKIKRRVHLWFFYANAEDNYEINSDGEIHAKNNNFWQRVYEWKLANYK